MYGSTETSPLIGDSSSQPSKRIESELGPPGKTLYSRWQSFAGVCFFVSMVGTTYAFGVYSTLLIDNLGFSQTGVDIIASVGNTGLYLSIFVGFGIEAYGLRAVVRFGGFLIFAGFLYIYLAVKSWVPADIASISVFFFIAQFGVSCHIASAVTCCIRLFPPEWRGSSVGLGKGYFGLSSAVLSDFCGGFFENSPASFLLFIAAIVPTVGSVGVSMTNFLPAKMIPFEYEAKRGLPSSFLPFYFHWMLLFITLLIVGFIQYAVPINDFVRAIFATILAGVVVSILWIPSYYNKRVKPNIDDLIVDPVSTTQLENENSSESLTSSTRNSSIFNDSSEREYETFPRPVSFSSPLIDSNGEYESFSNEREWSADKVAPEEDIDPSQAQDCFYGESLPISKSILTWRFWCLYSIYFTISGTGLMVIYNVDAIAEALNKYPSSFFVTLIALANGAGRFIVGISSDHVLKSFSKLQLMAIVSFFMALAQGLFSIGSPVLLYPCLLLVGFLFGGFVSLLPVTVADIFGTKHVPTNFGAIDSAPIFGSYFFATMIVSIFYKTNSSSFDDYTARAVFLLHLLVTFAIGTLL